MTMTEPSSRTFTVTVNAVNDAPTLDAIADPAAIDEDAGVQTVNLTRDHGRRRRIAGVAGHGHQQQHGADSQSRR